MFFEGTSIPPRGISTVTVAARAEKERIRGAWESEAGAYEQSVDQEVYPWLRKWPWKPIMATSPKGSGCTGTLPFIPLESVR